ncbi:hypothetical protein H5410_053503, partial [Solanum commersonii]
MSQSPSSSKKMLDLLNEIDPVAFYTSFDAPSSSKTSTITPVNIGETSPSNPQSFLDLNNPTPEPGPYSAMPPDHLFEGDLLENKSSESNILAANENLVGENSEHEGVRKGPEEEKEKLVKKLGKGKSKASVAKRVVSKKKVLGGRVFYPDIITKHRMDSLHDLMEIQLWTHLFQTKSPVLHKEEVREFYYNIEFEEDSSINTMVGDKSLHLTEELLEQILGVPEKGPELLKAQTEGPGTKEVKELKNQNDELLAKIATLQEKMIKDNDAANS